MIWYCVMLTRSDPAISLGSGRVRRNILSRVPTSVSTRSQTVRRQSRAKSGDSSLEVEVGSADEVDYTAPIPIECDVEILN